MLQIRKSQIEQQPGSQQAGLNIQAHVRDLLMSEASMPVAQAQQIADKFAQTVQNSSWVELSNGLTFERKFDPAKEPFSQEEQRTGILGPGKTVNPLTHIAP